MKLTAHFRLVPRLKMTRASYISFSPHAFMAAIGQLYLQGYIQSACALIVYTGTTVPLALHPVPMCLYGMNRNNFPFSVISSPHVP
jgi:hypothetical protein